jgi:hypothetical protein
MCLNVLCVYVLLSVDCKCNTIIEHKQRKVDMRFVETSQRINMSEKDSLMYYTDLCFTDLIVLRSNNICKLRKQTKATICIWKM